MLKDTVWTYFRRSANMTAIRKWRIYSSEIMLLIKFNLTTLFEKHYTNNLKTSMLNYLWQYTIIF